ncbi:hypothetical protein L202_05246 [Cryptococcus amylolentus CBS 6039]|uniref:Serine hydrolase domain-containing protein n=2 Tax=Cryptococcus amylolentus TaxID=104669 RepID=A0A1E3HJS0_9TREE|nr:hypothetical protein L202_05246 [Cryptococcus amylolentus CBS 6039]ODN76587.1 hypothetical protein L202_05246 [Cryptococcus amylolentus CBS 6039]ODO04571.1 hypothetical protein I350_05175 [Cryptococcus amylolentus CBS 6273]
MPILNPMMEARQTTGWQVSRTPHDMPRAWYDGGSDWHGDGGRFSQVGWFGEGLNYVRDFMIANGPFDGFFAFSSGAVLASIIVGMLEKGDGNSDFLPHPSLQPLDFFICISGFFPSGRHAPHPKYTYLYPLTPSTATLHVIGRFDTLLSSEECLYLAGLCPNRRVEYHNGAWMSSFLPGGSKGQYIPPVNSFSPAFIAKSQLQESIPDPIPSIKSQTVDPNVSREREDETIEKKLEEPLRVIIPAVKPPPWTSTDVPVRLVMAPRAAKERVATVTVYGGMGGVRS